MSPNYTSLQDVTSVQISQTTSWEARKGLSTSLSPKHTKDPSPQEVQKCVSIYFKKWEQDSATQRFWVQRHCSKHFRPDYPNPLAPTGTGGAVLRTVALPAFVSWAFLWLSLKQAEASARGVIIAQSPCTNTGSERRHDHGSVAAHEESRVPYFLESHNGGRQGEWGSSSAFLYLLAVNTSSVERILW